MIVDKTRAALLEAIKRTGPSAMLLLMLGLHSNPAFSQDDDFWKSFREARQEMLDDFEKYRKTALMDYDNYLRSEWKKFKLCKADKRPNIPKPKEHPVCTNYILPEVDIVVEVKKPVCPVVPRPTIEKVKLPKQMLDLDAKSKQKIPDIEYTGSGIEQSLMPPVERIPIMPALPNVPFVHVPASKQKSIQMIPHPLPVSTAISLVSATIHPGLRRKSIAFAQSFSFFSSFSIHFSDKTHIDFAALSR